MTSSADFAETPAEQARRVIARTAAIWRIPPASPREIARRASHGHVPARILRRMQAVQAAAAGAFAQQPALAHSW